MANKTNIVDQVFGWVAVVLIIAATIVTVTWASNNGEFEIGTQVAEEAITGESSTVEPESPLADWKTYEDATNSKISFIYPPEMDVILDEKRVDYQPPGTGFWWQIQVAGENNRPHLNVDVNPDGYGPFFPTETWTVMVGQDGYLDITGQTDSDTSTYDPSVLEAQQDGARLIIVTYEGKPEGKAPNGNAYGWRFGYTVDENRDWRVDFETILENTMFFNGTVEPTTVSYTMECGGLPQFYDPDSKPAPGDFKNESWWNPFISQIPSSWQVPSVCYNSDLNKVAYLRIDGKADYGTAGKHVIGVYNIDSDTFDRTDAMTDPGNFPHYCSKVTSEWTRTTGKTGSITDNIQYVCVSGDAGWGSYIINQFSLPSKKVTEVRSNSCQVNTPDCDYEDVLEL